MSVDSEKNKLAFFYSQTVAQQLLPLCQFFIQPLGITTFGYKRVYDDGQYLFISTNQQWAEYHYQNVQEHGPFFEEAMNKACLNQSYKILWPASSKDCFLQALNNYNMWHGINFYKRRENYLELWTFSTFCDRESITSLYLNIIPYFEEFIHYFALKAQEMFNFNLPLKLAGIKPVIPSPALLSLEPKSLEEIIKQIKIQKILVNSSKGVISLTPRESECIRLLAIGKTCKEIATSLNLSPRTVECYINQTKKKTNCYSKSKLLTLIQNGL